MTSELPDALCGAIDQLVAPFSTADLRKHAQSLSSGYRTREDIRHTLSPIDAAAYLCVRFPSTYAVAGAVWQEIFARLKGQAIKTVLDAGSGPGTASLALLEHVPGASITLLERDPGWKPIAEICARALGTASRFMTGSIEHAGTAAYDAIVASYSLNELPSVSLEATVRGLWQRASQILVVIEPGTPLGFDVVRRTRDLLLAMGAHTIAPCTHDLACPMTGSDWCHRPVRVYRSEIHRRVKDADLGYEDEKFCFAAFSRTFLPAIPSGRIVRKPMLGKGHLHVDVCRDGEIKRLTYSRKNGATYKAAKDSAWGELWDAD